ncbi:MAG TPA: ribosome rescue protein RqcH [Nitrososphaeraceae archaeon]|nr:ribosome rescue protein RqcH [Nitrososphaeraceae archaeon]
MKVMELSGLELHCLIEDIRQKLSQGYYVSTISSISRDSFSLKMHHPNFSDVILVLSTRGIWITRMNFRTFEDSPIISSMRTELERAKFENIEQIGDERVAYLKFRHLDGSWRILVVEIFRKGNIIVCDGSKVIITVLNPVEVRHRTLRVGTIYQPPPPRGLNMYDLSIRDLMELREKERDPDIEVEKWLGRNVSLSKKYVEEIITRAKMKHMKLTDATKADIETVFKLTMELVSDICDTTIHKPLVVLDDAGRPTNVIPFHLESISKAPAFVPYETLMGAVDAAFSDLLIEEGSSKRTVELDNKIADLEHDYSQQNQAESEVIEKSNAIRKLAQELMTLPTIVTDTQDKSLTSILEKHSSEIVKVAGRELLQVLNESIPFDPHLPRTSSLLFDRAKELERGCQSIRNAKSRIVDQMEELRRKANLLQKKAAVKPQVEKEWFERYRWFIGSEGLLCIGGRDASSNSAIIRKHLTDQDLVFHAEIHGSPFFIVKNVPSNGVEQIRISLLEAAQATVSFSRAWKDGLSVADAYWVIPDQVKKGAPTGQFLPKGSFVIEGKRNYVKGVEIRLALGVIILGKKYAVMCGPQEAVKMKSIAYCVLLPGGNDPTNIAKKFKQEMVRVCTDISEEFKDIVEYLKAISIDEIVRSIPHGPSKILITKRGDLLVRSLGEVHS